jgi:dynein heavy chain, axonemal
MVANKDPSSPKPCPPTIEAFREMIDGYESLHVEIEAIQPFQIFSSFFQVDVRPFRQALINIVRRWGNMFKDHLVNSGTDKVLSTNSLETNFLNLISVTNSLTDLSDFIHKADQGLLQIVEDYETLVSIMAFLLQVKERAVTTDNMFEPMRGTIDLLKYYDMDIPEEVNVLLQELPEQWNNTKKLAVTVKQQVAPLQATEVISIRNRIANFDTHINVFREMFRTYEFFKYDCGDPYSLLDRISDDIYRLENEMAAINQSGSLFEVNVPEFKLLKQCRRELKMLKVRKMIQIIFYRFKRFST